MVHTSMHQPHTMSGVDIRMWTLQTAAMNGWLATRQMMIIVGASLSAMALLATPCFTLFSALSFFLSSSESE